MYIPSPNLYVTYAFVDVLVYPSMLCGCSECFCSLLLATSQRSHSW
jgi:hypothetical protein